MRTYTIMMLAAVLCLVLSACAHPTVVQKPLAQWNPEASQRAFAQAVEDRSTDLLVLMAFSGGGTRAASFSYGVLQELAETTVMTASGPRRLIDEVDMISSVSGGSFTNAYFGLYGDAIFKDFESVFLRKDIQGDLQNNILSPGSWSALWSSTYSRSDIAAQYYHENVFQGATFADLQRPGAPVVVINATDLATGLRFPFSRPLFDLICSDYDKYPISRALAATSAVPVLLTPITLKNYAGTCGYTPGTWLTKVLQDVGNSNRKVDAQSLADFLDSETRPWLHLVDGGISDNLGLRSLINTFNFMGSSESDPLAALDRLGHTSVRHILIVLVNSNNRPHLEWALKQDTPSTLNVAAAVSSDQINRYSLESIRTTDLLFTTWAQQLSTADRHVSFDFVRVDFEGVTNDAERKKLRNIGTNFSLSDEEIDRLISAARQVLRASPEFKAFLERTSGRTGKP
jgi:NTE family protein